MVGGEGVSVVVEHHTCTLEMVITPGEKSPWGMYRCTHHNLDGTHCQVLVTGHNLPYSGAGSHVTSSEAIRTHMGRVGNG